MLLAHCLTSEAIAVVNLSKERIFVKLKIFGNTNTYDSITDCRFTPEAILQKQESQQVQALIDENRHPHSCQIKDTNGMKCI